MLPHGRRTLVKLLNILTCSLNNGERDPTFSIELHA
jgi:hypothetical protein